MENDIAVLTITSKDSINLAMGEANGTPAAPTKGTANPTLESVSTDSSPVAVLPTLTTITDQLTKLEKQGGSHRGDQGNTGDVGGGGGSPVVVSGEKKNSVATVKKIMLSPSRSAEVSRLTSTIASRTMFPTTRFIWQQE